MGKNVEIFKARSGLRVYIYSNNICLLFVQKDKQVFIEDRYNPNQESSDSKRLYLSDKDYEKSIRQAMKIMSDKLKTNDLHFISRPALKEEEKERNELWRKVGIKFLVDGRVQVRRWKRVGKKLEIINIFVRDIDAAISMQNKALNTYWDSANKYRKVNEVKFSFLVQKIFLKANEMYLIWDQIDLKKRADLQNEYNSLIDDLRNCRNKEKKEIQEQAKKLLLSKDSLGRDNASAFAARSVGALNSTCRRLVDINNISLKIILRREYLIAYRHYLEDSKMKSIKVLESLIRTSPKNISNYFFGIRKAISFLDRVLVKPYAPYFLKVKIILREVERRHRFFSEEQIQEQIKISLEILKSN